MNTANRKIHTQDDDSQSTTRKVASVAHEAIEGAADKAEPVEQKLRDGAHKAGEQLEASQAAAAEQVQQSVKSVERFVKEKPLAATGIAFASGVLAALILRR